MTLPDLTRPDFYIAAMGRSGSTLLCDWLTHPPDQIALSEPMFFSNINPNMLRIQLENFGFNFTDEDWNRSDEHWHERFQRLFQPILAERRWGFKEVLSEEHVRAVEQLLPQRIVISVRNIRDVAASFLEKHKIQENVDRFDHQWVEKYCISQSAALMQFPRKIAEMGLPCRIQRYEDFIGSDCERLALANFVGWRGDGQAGRHHDRLNRAFEVERHGDAVGSQLRRWEDRELSAVERRLVETITEQCGPYQRFFGYA